MMVHVIQYDLQKIGSSILNKTGPQRDAFYTQLQLKQVSVIHFVSEEENTRCHPRTGANVNRELKGSSDRRDIVT